MYCQKFPTCAGISAQLAYVQEEYEEALSSSCTALSSSVVSLSSVHVNAHFTRKA